MPDKKLRKQVMNIVTDSTPLEEPKDPDTCNVFALYKILASEADIATMRENYERGGYGYGHAKQAFYELLINEFKEERERYTYFMENKAELDRVLSEGADKARLVASDVLKRVREKVGY